MQKTLFCDEEIDRTSTENKTKRLLVMDAGERLSNVKVYDSHTQSEHWLSLEEYIKIFRDGTFAGVSFDEHDKIYNCSELAHFLLQKDYSLSQVFHKSQMEEMLSYINMSDKFEMIAWSEKMTPAALRLSRLPKDTGDCKAIASWISLNNQYDKMKKIKSIEDLEMPEVISIGNDWRANITNADMNKAQKVNYGLIKKHNFIQSYDLCPVMRDIILPQWESMIEKLPEPLLKLWNVNGWKDAYKKKKTLANYPEWHKHITENRNLIRISIRSETTKHWNKGDVVIKDWIPEIRGIYSAFNGIFDYHGNLREHPMNEGKIVSNNWLHDHYYRESPHHHKGGVGRAIHYHYVFPNYVANCWEEIHGKQTWPRYSQNYDCEFSEKKKRNNRGSLTLEQNNFLQHHRRMIRKLIRDNVWSKYTQRNL